MLEHNALKLRGLLSSVAGRFQQDLIRLTQSNYVEIGSHERIGFEALPLRPIPDVVVGLSEIPYLLYGSDPEAEAVLAAWDTLATCLVTGSKFRIAAEAASDVFPFMPTYGHNLMDVAIRFIYAAGWNGAAKRAPLIVGPKHIYLVVDGYPIGFMDSNVLLGKARRRLRKFPPPDIQGALVAPLGARRVATARTTGLYRRLTTALPDQADVIHSVFTAAVQAGREYERLVTDPFDLEIVPVADPLPNAWSEARRIVRDALINPVPEIYKLLRPYIAHADFIKQFGNPHRPGGVYSLKTRAKHLEVIASVELAAYPTPPGSEQLSLLSFQDTIARIHV